MRGFYWLCNQHDITERDWEGIDGGGKGPHWQVQVGEAVTGRIGGWRPGQHVPDVTGGCSSLER
jgi:hypothetical protein